MLLRRPSLWALLLSPALCLVACDRVRERKVDLPTISPGSPTVPAPAKRLPAGTVLVRASSGVGAPTGLQSATQPIPAAARPTAPPPLDAATQRIVEHQLRLSQQFLLHQPAHNAVLSGWLAHALVATMQAAAQHEKPFASALGFARADETLGALGRLRRRVLADARAAGHGKQLRLMLALGVFTAGATGPVSATYRERLRDLATVRHLPQTVESIREIDRWIAKQTAGTVSDAFTRDTSGEMPELVAIATGYLKAPWQLPFDVRDTAPGPFFTARCSSKTTPLMHKTMHLPALAARLAYVVDVPFIGRDFSMRLVVPKAVDGLKIHRRALTALLHRQLDGRLQEQQIRLVLPRMHIPANVALLETAKATVPLVGQLRPYPHFGTTLLRKLVKLNQYGFLKVEEWGAEASLALIGTIGYGGAPRITEVRADHPFLLSIRHQPSGASLFVAQIFALGEPSTTRGKAPCFRAGGEVKQRLGGPGQSRAPLRFTLTPKKGAEVARRIVRRHLNELRFCALRALSRPGSSKGPLRCRMTLRIGNDGRASVSGLQTVGPAGKEACACMAQSTYRWRFPVATQPGERVRKLDVRLVERNQRVSSDTRASSQTRARGPAGR